MRLVMCAVVALTASPAIAEDSKAEEVKAAKAKLGVRAIEKALKTYYTANGKWPAKLDDVAPLLENGKKDLTDPWGKAYRFEVEKTTEGGKAVEKLYVWTEREVNGKTEVYGNRPKKS